MTVADLPTTIHDVLERLRAAATSDRDLGDRFERLMRSWLTTAAPWSTRFDEVWQWMDWPGRDNAPDTGIDLVARERDGGGLCAIQCKCYDADGRIDKSDIDSFFTASGKSGFTSRLVISTTDNWSKHADDALRDQQIPSNRLDLTELDQAGVDWSAFDIADPETLPPLPEKSLRPHQRQAIDAVTAGFMSHDRGRMIMACGTGKTYTALKLVEQLLPRGGRVLFLVPSISLLSQSLVEWTAASALPLHPLAVCSDPKASQRAKSEDASAHDLALPATTDPQKLIAGDSRIAATVASSDALTVVFSTYQSLGVIHDAQQLGLPDFDIVICDEAHRTTGATLAGDDESAFVRIHDADFIRAAKRLYMTATPRIYADEGKSKAAESGTVVASMDDERLFGPELHRLGFGEAVERDLLSDYKVLVLAVDEQAVEPIWQRMMTDDDNAELQLDDVAKLVGCWNGLAKRGVDRERLGIGADLDPMRRAVAFAQNIKQSQLAADRLEEVSAQLEQSARDGERALRLAARHVDGTFNVLKRNERLAWLKADTTDKGDVCRILSNVRCLSEGVDVPALDAVLFLTPRNSQVDIVQSVGRVMRRAPGKDYGYIILPIGIPADMSPEEALRDNKRYAAVWQVLQALRAHDDRFDAIINKIDLNRSRDDKLQIIGVGRGGDGDGDFDATSVDGQQAWDFASADEWRDAIYAKVVQKVGQRAYWEQWSSDVAQLAERHEARITALVGGADAGLVAEFDQFVAALRHQINESITATSAIQMLAQHMITKPVFEALFEHYDFAAHNPIAQAMQRMLDALEGRGFDESQVSESLQKFYDSVRARAAGIDNAEGKQRIIKDLYEKFFKLAFPKIADSLGIVYTPIEVVDWIIDAVETVLQKQFGVSVADPGVHVIDPFTGTGTFIVRLMQSGLFTPEQLAQKFGDGTPGSSEIHANELLLLAYYVAAVNIESTFHAIVSQDGLKTADYLPFSGILLTDTFLRGAGDDVESLDGELFPENNERAKAQDQLDITVVIGNPPYSAGQTSQNDANQNLKYPALDARIAETYAAGSTATNKNSLYDSYIRAIRWASDRIEDRGVVAFVTNGAYIDSNTADGLRLALADEFTELWIYNLRGDARTSGPQRKKEAGNVFGGGSRTPVAIMVLVRDTSRASSGAVHYRDIGDFVSREDKLAALTCEPFVDLEWQTITPNADGDWVNKRDPRFEAWTPIGDVFLTFCRGLSTGRDAWLCNASSSKVRANVKRMVEFYNGQADTFVSVDELDLDPTKFSWNRADKVNVARSQRYALDESAARVSQYRPFHKQHVWFDRQVNDMVYRLPAMYPSRTIGGRAVCMTSAGSHYEFAPILVDALPNLHVLDTAQTFPRYSWQPVDEQAMSVDEDDHVFDGYRRIDNINAEVLAEYRRELGDDITGDDLFDYVYGLLHSPEYRTRFAADLNKMLPRIPRAATRASFDAFRDAGRALGDLHVNYESATPYPLKEVIADSAPTDDYERWRVDKMRFAKVRSDDGKLVADRSTVIYNAHLTLSGIPDEAYRYVLGPRSAIEWIIDRYQVRTDKPSGIVNDPNDWSREVGDPRYIVDLLKRIVTVSLETNRIVDALPSLDLD